MAPEVQANQTFSGADADFFALGVIAFIMLMGRPPFVHTEFTDPHYRPLYNCNRERRSEDFWKRQRLPNLNNDCKEFIMGLLAVQPTERIRTAEDIR